MKSRNENRSVEFLFIIYLNNGKTSFVSSNVFLLFLSKLKIKIQVLTCKFNASRDFVSMLSQFFKTYKKTQNFPHTMFCPYCMKILIRWVKHNSIICFCEFYSCSMSCPSTKIHFSVKYMPKVTKSRARKVYTFLFLLKIFLGTTT